MMTNNTESIFKILPKLQQDKTVAESLLFFSLLDSNITNRGKSDTEERIHLANSMLNCGNGYESLSPQC